MQLQLHYTNYITLQLQLPLHCTTRRYTTTTTTLLFTTIHQTTLHYTTLQYTTLQYTTIHYTNYTTPQLQLQLHYTNYTTLQLQLHYTTTKTTTALHHTTSSRCGEVTTATIATTPNNSNQPLGPSVDSLCHQWFTTTNLSSRRSIFETSATALCGTTGAF